MPHEDLVAALRKTPPSKGMLATKPDDAIKGMAQKKLEQQRPEDKGKRKAPVPGARMAPDGLFYVPDPSRPGKYLQVDHGEDKRTGSSVGS